MISLPAETLCEIFMYVLLARKAKMHDSYPDKVRFSNDSILVPLAVSRVCKSWRSIALSYGELWSHLFIIWYGSASTRRERRKKLVEIFDTWLERTNGCPINFSFHTDLIGSSDEEAEYVSLALLAQQHLWKEVDFEWHGFNPTRNFPGLKLTNMPLLSSLGLSARTKEVLAFIDISQSPKLARLYLRGNFELSRGQGTVLPLSESSHVLYCGGSSWTRSSCQGIQLLKTLPNLKNFHGRFGRVYTRDPIRRDDGNAIVLHNLENLMINGSEGSAEIINNVTLPSLKALNYGSEYHEYGFDHLSRFILRSLPPLTFLSVSGRGCDERKLIPILRLLPMLIELRIMNGSLSSWFFSAMTVTDAPQFHGIYTSAMGDCLLCPSLQALRLLPFRVSGGPLDPCIEVIILMLKSRSQILKTFKRACCCHDAGTCIKLDDPELNWDVEELRKYFLGWGLNAFGDDIPPYPFKGWNIE